MRVSKFLTFTWVGGSLRIDTDFFFSVDFADLFRLDLSWSTEKVSEAFLSDYGNS